MPHLRSRPNVPKKGEGEFPECQNFDCGRDLTDKVRHSRVVVLLTM